MSNDPAEKHQGRLSSMSKMKRPFKIIVGLIIIILLLVAVVSYQHRGGEAGRLSRAISPYFELPKEKPTVATVTDKSKLSNQTFFTQAQNGDKLLIYPNAHLVVMYRPSIHKVVDIAPVQQ